MQFIHRHQLPFDLFSDPSNDVAESYGIVHDHDGMIGISGPRPAYFLLDSDLTVVYADVAEQWPPALELDEVEQAVHSV
jgi:peroxiredoxin